MSGENGEHAQDSGPRATSWGEVVRLRTLPAAVAPVILGAGAAAAMGELSVLRSLLAAGVALALQIGCNLANATPTACAAPMTIAPALPA